MANSLQKSHSNAQLELISELQFLKEKMLIKLFRSLAVRVKQELSVLDENGSYLNAHSLANRFRQYCASLFQDARYLKHYFFLGFVHDSDRSIELWLRWLGDKYAQHYNHQEHVDNWRWDQIFQKHEQYLKQYERALLQFDSKMDRIQKEIQVDQEVQNQELTKKLEENTFLEKLSIQDPQTLDTYQYRHMPFIILAESNEFALFRKFKTLIRSQLSAFQEQNKLNELVSLTQLYYEKLDELYRMFPSFYLTIKRAIRDENADLEQWLLTFRQSNREAEFQSPENLSELESNIRQYDIIHEQAQLTHNYEVKQISLQKEASRLEKQQKILAEKQATLADKKAKHQLEDQAKTQQLEFNNQTSLAKQQQKEEAKKLLKAQKLEIKNQVAFAKNEQKSQLEAQKLEKKHQTEQAEKDRKAKLEQDKLESQKLKAELAVKGTEVKKQFEMLTAGEQTKEIEAKKVVEQIKSESAGSKKIAAKNVSKQSEIPSPPLQPETIAESPISEQVESIPEQISEPMETRAEEEVSIESSSISEPDQELIPESLVEPEIEQVKESEPQIETEVESINASEVSSILTESTTESIPEEKAEENLVEITPSPETRVDLYEGLSDKQRAEIERAKLKQENQQKKAEIDASVQVLHEEYVVQRAAIETDVSLSESEKDIRLIEIAKERAEKEIVILTEKAESTTSGLSEDELSHQEEIQLNEERQRELEEQSKKPRLKALAPTEIEEIWGFYFLHRYNHPAPDEYYGDSRAKEIIKRMLQQITANYNKINPSKVFIEKFPGKSKFYYIGDLDGSFKDVDQLMRYLQPKIFESQATDNPLRIVFLGNYLGNNPMDVHNLLYLICFNLLYPREVLLLRGNHEEKSANIKLAFGENILKNFDQDLLDDFNAFFAKLPVVHLVDSVHKKIVSVHGGPPIKPEDPEKAIAIRRLTFKSFKESFEEMDTISQQFLNNNPGIELSRGIQFNPLENGLGFEFSKHLFLEFMRKNKLDLMVRSNQALPEGYGFYWNNKLLSLYSCSELEGKPIPAKICEVLFPADPEYAEDDDLQSDDSDDEDEEEPNDEDGNPDKIPGEEPVESDEESDEDEIDEDEDKDLDEEEKNPAEQNLENIKEVVIRVLDLDTLQS